MRKVIGTQEALSRFFEAARFFQNRIGLVWLIDSSRQVSPTCYEVKPSEMVKHCDVILQAIALAAGCHVESAVEKAAGR